MQWKNIIAIDKVTKEKLKELDDNYILQDNSYSII